ncbi:MAG: DMT family transporter [Muribaculaceae bacterium]|nr:DMT family transporter [Muribaculaceae bacterium]
MKNIGDLNLKGHMAMLGANVCWGLMSPIAKLVFASGMIAPIIIVDFRIAGAAILFWLTSLFTPDEHVPIIDKLRLFGAGMIGILLNQGCFIIGVSYTSPGEASLVTTTMPMWVMLLAWMFLKEPITLKKAGGILFGAAGALILVLGGSGNISGGDNPALGDFIVLMAQLSYALYLTIYRNFIRKYSLVTLMKWMFLSATIVGLPSTIGFLKTTDWGAISLSEWMGVAYIVFFATYIAYICIMIGQKNLRPTIVGMYNYVQPIVATIVGISLGMDHFTFPKVLAVVLIFSGVYLVTISKAAPCDDSDKRKKHKV